jgi:hypothetical protein
VPRELVAYDRWPQSYVRSRWQPTFISCTFSKSVLVEVGISFSSAHLLRIDSAQKFKTEHNFAAMIYVFCVVVASIQSMKC